MQYTIKFGVVLMSAKAPTRTRALKPNANWSQLVDDCVEVWLSGHHVCTGIVEEATADDGVLWIAAEGTRTRQLFDKLSGYEVRA
jgi:hypothetical protein